MTSGAFTGDNTPNQTDAAAETQRPDWADGLRQLYDAVVDEPLPDSFKDLIDQLDTESSGEDGCGADGSDGSAG